MAEEELLTSTVASPTAIADGHKRKLEDLEPLTDSDPIPDPDSNTGDGEKNGGADESDSKRPRLESNGDNDIVADGEVSVNGHQEEQKEDEREEEEAAQSDSVVNNSSSVEVQEPGQEPMDTITEESAFNENVKDEIRSAEDPGQTKEEAEEPSQDLGETKAEVVEPSQDLGETIAEVEEPSQDLVDGKAEVDEPSEEIPREGDVPVASADTELGSDAQILSRKIDVPNDKVGVLIGKAGDTIRSLQDNSGAKIQIMRDADADPRAPTRPLELVGTLKNINKAEKLIKGVIAEADAGGSPSLIARGFSTMQATTGGEQVEMQVPIEKVGIIIGKGGETIRNMQTRSGARIQLLQQSLDGESRQRTVRMTGNKKQIETAREMIRDVMNQTVRQSPLSGAYNQQGFRPRGPASPQWGPRGHHGPYSGPGYNYPQRGQYPSQGSQYPPPYGNYPPQQGPRSNYGPSWDQRPPASMHGPPHQGNYNYGQQQQGPDYGHHPAPYSQAPPQQQPYGQGGYNEAKYDHQPYGHNVASQPAPYPHSGYGPPQEQYGKPPTTYGTHPQQAYVQQQPRPSQPGEIPYTQSYAQNVQPQQSYPYAPPTGPMQQQNYPPYGPGPTTDGYSHPPATASAYPQQPGAYPQGGPGYGSYPTTGQPGYAEQPAAAAAAANTAAAYGYPQGQADPAYAAAAGQAGYAQPAQTQPAYDQSVAYGNAPAATGYGKTTSPHPAAYPQYDSTGQMYGAQR